MSPATLRLVMLVSCAHALVHIYELSLPSVEQLIGQSFQVTPETTGWLGTVWRIPWGVGALIAGWLADRVGCKRMLVVYLCGCAATSALAWWSPGLPLLFTAMFAMGSFASIYHPAGLALISHATDPNTRGKALGVHGIIGSMGIAAAPFLAGLALGIPGVGWRQYFLLLTLPGALLALLFSSMLREPRHEESSGTSGGGSVHVEDEAHWGSFLLLVAAGTVSGFVYASLMHFLPRYLTGASNAADIASNRLLLTGVVLLFGTLGQGFAGHVARPDRLEPQLLCILLANVPCLVWMALAEGNARLWAACLMMFVHFMNQPVYNSLIAHYVPRHRRSVGYGFSNMLCFGLGALGPAFSGELLERGGPVRGATWMYLSLAGLMLVAAHLALFLWGHMRRKSRLKQGL